MRPTPGELFLGVAPEIIRDCADQLRDRDSFSLADFCKALGAPRHEAIPVLDALVRSAFIAKNSGRGRLRPTSKMAQLALARITHGLQHERATELLNGIVDRAKHVNSHPEEFYTRVKRLAVFGSYLGKKRLLGDLDVAYHIEPLRQPRLPSRITIRELVKHDYGRKTIVFLRKRNRHEISLHEWSELVGLKTRYRLVFEDTQRSE
jgi:predicted nucleotidyltransferase